MITRISGWYWIHTGDRDGWLCAWYNKTRDIFITINGEYKSKDIIVDEKRLRDPDE